MHAEIQGRFLISWLSVNGRFEMNVAPTIQESLSIFKPILCFQLILSFASDVVEEPME
jgi:hypothetical protein